MDIKWINKRRKEQFFYLAIAVLFVFAAYHGINGIQSSPSTIVEAAKKPTYEIKKGILLKYNGRESTVTIPNNVTAIGEGAFEDNKFIMKVIVPEAVVSMGDGVFRGCVNLEEVILSNNLIEMGIGCFVNCESLKTVEWSIQLKKIPSFTFMHSGIEEFDFAKAGIEAIGEEAFQGSQIKKVWMPDTIKELGNKTFAMCRQLKEIRLSNQLKIIPSGFCALSSIMAVEIPDSVERIDEMAFAQCEDLNIIMGGNNVKEIKAMAFYDTKWFEQKDQPLQIGFVYVKDSGILERVVIPEQVQMIYEEAFKDNTKLKEVVLPSQLKIIGEEAFYRCKKLTKVVFGNRLEEIRRDAFRSCIALEEVKFPESLQTIEDTAFANCKSLSTYQFPQSEVDFGENVFYGVEQGNAGEFNQFIVANQDTLIAYVDTAKEDELRIPDGVKKIGENVFNLSHMIEKLYIPGTVTVIEKGSFEFPEIQTIILEEGVKEIQKDSFYHCYTNRIVIPDSVEKIGSLKTWSDSKSPLTVVCSKNSYAYDYAKKHNITIQSA